jgi:hypothetical protein
MPAAASIAEAPRTASAGQSCAGVEPPEVYRGAPPWSQAVLDAGAAWPFGRGEGVVVALLSSGVDASNEQLAAATLPGYDVLGSAPGADTDCDGRGTRAAGVLAAGESPETSVHGVSPGVQVLPVRVVQRVTREGDESQSEDLGGGPEQLAAGILWAAEQGARVICVTVTTEVDDPVLQSAVAAASDAGAVVVAGGPNSDGAAVSPDEAPPARYPSAYPRVLAVGALGRDGQLLASSERARYLDILAPAADTITTAPTGGRGGLAHAATVDDPASATAAVAGAIALVLARDPELSAEAAADRVVGTALPAARSIAATLGAADGTEVAADGTDVAADGRSGAPASPPVVHIAAAVSAHLVTTREPSTAVRATPVPDASRFDASEGAALAGAAAVAIGGLVVVTVVVVIRSRRGANPSPR